MKIQQKADVATISRAHWVSFSTIISKKGYFQLYVLLKVLLLFM